MRIYQIDYIDCAEAVEDVTTCSVCGRPKSLSPIIGIGFCEEPDYMDWHFLCADCMESRKSETMV